MKLHDYRQTIAHMRRPGFDSGSPPPKPEQKTPFIDKLKNLKEVAPGLMPRSKVSILKMYMDEALRDGEITQEQHTEMLMPYFGELGENVTEQIEVSDRDNFQDGSGPLAGLDRMTRAPGKGIKKTNIESIEENIKKITYLNKETGETIDVYKTLITDAPKKIEGKQIAGKGGDYKTLLSEEFGSLEEAQKARDDFREKNPKKYPEKDPNKDYASKEKRRTAEKATQGRIIAFGAPKGYVAHHMKPLAGRLDMTDRDIAIVSEKMNAKMSKFDKPMNDLVDESMALDFNDTKSIKRLDEINKELAGYVKQAEKELPKKYKGLLGFNKLTPVLDTFDNEGRQIFDIEEVGTDYKKSIGGKEKGIPLRDTKTGIIREQVANAPKLKAALLPGLEELVEGIKNIPDDIAKKRYFKLGVKALGPLGAYIGISDTYKALKDGKPVAEALEYGLIGTDLIGSTKDVLALSPEGKEARSVVKQGEMREQITDDFSSLDTDFDTPNVKSEMSRSEAERKWENEKVAIGRKRAAEEKAISNARAVSIEGLKNLMTGQRFAGQQIPEQFLAVGGRVGYADGPDDPSKRKFIKLGAGLMSLPIIGKYLKFAAPVAEKSVEIIRRGADGVPDFIMDLIAKVKLKAESTGMKYFTGNRSDEFADVYQADDFVVTQRGNKTTVKKRNQEGDMLEKDMEMEIETDPETGGVTYNEATARPDAEGKLKDVEEFIDDIDLEDMRKYTYDD